jgi:outer membrane murein-binding lipoprotein Lpp
MRVTGRRKSTLAAAMVVGALVLAAGCMQTQEIDQTLPPYASISDEDRDPASAPKPQSSDDSDGVMSEIGAALMYPVHLIFW